MPGLTSFLLALGIITNASAQWQPTQGPYGGYIMSMTHTGAEVYAGTYTHGIYRSANNGDTWTAMNDGLPVNTTVNAIAISSSGLSIGTYAGVYRSGTLDTSWGPLNNGLGTTSVLALVAKESSLFAATGDQVFRSLDDGASWQAINNGLEEQDCSDCPGELYQTGCLLLKDSLLFMGTVSGVMRTGDNGDNWTAVNQGLDPTATWSVAALATNGNAVFAGMEGKVYRSYDNGDNWVQLATAWPVANILSLACTGTELFVGLWGEGIYRSIDDGNSWSEFNNNLVNRVPYVLEPTPSWLFCGTLNGGVSRTAQDVPDWSFANDGLVRAGVRTLCADGSDLLAGASGCGIYSLGSDSLSWTLSNTGITSGFIHSINHLEGETFAGTSIGLYRRASSSSPWTPAYPGLGNSVVTSMASQNGFLFAGSSNGIFRSAVGVLNWDTLGNAGTIYNVLDLLALDTVIYAATSHGIFRSTDNGINWTSMNLSSNTYVPSLTMKEGILLAGTWGGILRFNPVDQAWEPIINSLTGHACSAFATFDSLLVVGTDIGAFISQDNGVSWAEINQGLGEAPIASLAVFGGYLYAGLWDGGVWRRGRSDIHTEVSELSSPNEGLLLRGGPNPFNSTTNLRYTLSKPVPVALRIFDVRGVEVFSLGEKNLAAGLHQTTWNAQALPSGIYLCRLQAGDQVRTVRLVKVE